MIGTSVVDLGQSAGQSAPQASLSVSVDTSENNVTVNHQGGDAINQENARVIIENASGESLTWDPAAESGTFSVGGSAEFSTNATGGAAADNVDVTGDLNGLVNPDVSGSFPISTGDQITVTLIDTESQRQIFETSVTA